MTDPVIHAENLGKLYRIGATQLPYRSLRDTLTDAFTAPFRRLRAAFRAPDAQHATSNSLIWALKDVSFSIQQGEVVGIIGHNGAGKSTLLKILSRITEPTEGRVQIRGRVGSLLEVGTGFHSELTGRENIYLNGAILGMRRAEIDRKFDEIVAFSEFEKFIDTPVKHYSSGMHMRLAFSVAAHLEPEILLVDEVLAVGDVAFQKKCLGKMGNVAQEGRTVLFVSHNMQAVRTLCSRSLLLREGRIVADSSSAETIAEYYKHLQQGEINAATAVYNPAYRRGSGAVRFAEVRIQDEMGRDTSDFTMGQTIRFALGYEVFAPVNNLFVSICLRAGGSPDYVTSVWHAVSERNLSPGETGALVVELPNPRLRPGDYPLYFWLGNRMGQAYDLLDNLTQPLSITTDKEYEELGFDPTLPTGLAGFVDTDSTLVVK